MSPVDGGRSERPWLLVNLGFTPHGGQDLANYALAEELVRRGREVTLVAHDISSELRSHGNVTVVEVRRPLGSNLLGERLLERAGLEAFRQHPRRNEVHFVGNAGCCPGANVTWAHFVHHAWAPRLAAGAPALRRLANPVRARDARARELRAFDFASIVITNSDRTSRDVEGCGIPAAKIRRIYLGATEPTREAVPAMHQPTEPTLAFVGALGWDTRKGLDLALRALALLVRQAKWKHRLVVAGNGSARPWVRLASELGVLDRVDFVGFLQTPEVILTRADLLLSPVRYEPYGLAIQEALCSGLPVLISRNAGIVERLPPECGRMVMPDDAGAAEWANGISGSAREPGLAADGREESGCRVGTEVLERLRI